VIVRFVFGPPESGEAACAAACFVAHRMPIDATSDTLHDIAWALVGLGLFVPGAAIRHPGARLC